VPFLRLTRDRRGVEHTFLLHTATPGERARVLYWYRTAPDVLIGRPALDEEAIRTIEEQHPEIEFDWPAIPRCEAMPPEEEQATVRQPRRGRPGRWEGAPSRPMERRAAPAEPGDVEPEEAEVEVEAGAPEAVAESEAPTTRGLLEELVGREIATRLRARHAEVMARIHEQGFDEQALAAWVTRAEALDPDTWLTPDAVLAGVRDADARFEDLRRALLERPRSQG
jgi:hypothetical protein